jgi:hypothetical protein
MTERFCKKCNHLCHCIEADHEGCKCDGCECNSRAEAVLENEGGLVIDDTGECESCQ